MNRILLPHEWRLTASPPLTLYVHFPWCVRKCPYCDFNSHTAQDAVPETRYIDALLADLEQALPAVWGRPVHAIFMGGGTPSLFSPASIDRLLAAIRSLLPLDPLAEITLEANPGTLEAGRFREYRFAGINRLSLGIQSFNDRHLTALGRIHGASEAHAAIELAAMHFDNFNLDLMYALPGQTLSESITDLDTALAAGPPHLSCYHLTLEPNTPFWHHPPDLPDDDLAADMQQAIEQRLEHAGYLHYETSAFSRPGQHSRHNTNYWQFGDYLGIGAGAHGKLSSHDGIVRELRHPHPRNYMEQTEAGNPLLQRQPVRHDALAFEFMMNALRLSQGFHPALFSERTGLPLILVQTQLDTAIRRGLLQQDDARIAPTPQGRRFLNDLLALFLPDAREQP